jgi:RNA polymerase sigma-70 factor (ECF subfamily)
MSAKSEKKDRSPRWVFLVQRPRKRMLMSSSVTENSSETNRLLRGAAEGHRDRWEALVQKHHARLRRMVSLRLDRRLRGWINPSEVIRQAAATGSSRCVEYLQNPSEPFFVWLRRLTGQTLQLLQRHRLGEALENSRELSLQPGSIPAASSMALAVHLLGQTPALHEAELRARRLRFLEEALNGMAAPEREMLALRHFEQLNNAETAADLGLTEAEASKLYIRALKRLKEILQGMPGEIRPQQP